jgi:hypothetical protein
VESWRAHNRRRWEQEKDVLPVDEAAPFVCECSSDACCVAVEMTMREFEDAHMCPSWCAVFPGHVMEGDGVRVHSKHRAYWVVELFACSGLDQERHQRV